MRDPDADAMFERVLSSASREDLVRRLRNQHETINSYAEALDGLGVPPTIRGSGSEGTRTPREIQAVVAELLRKTRTLEEEGREAFIVHNVREFREELRVLVGCRPSKRNLTIARLLHALGRVMGEGEPNRDPNGWFLAPPGTYD